MLNKRVWISLSEAEWAVLETQQRLGRYKTIGNCISAQIVRYQESWSDHLEYPSIQQLLAKSSPVQPKSGLVQPKATQSNPIQSNSSPTQSNSSPVQPKTSPINPNNPNGF